MDAFGVIDELRQAFSSRLRRDFQGFELIFRISYIFSQKYHQKIVQSLTSIIIKYKLNHKNIITE